jgi:hypothetical protein
VSDLDERDHLKRLVAVEKRTKELNRLIRSSLRIWQRGLEDRMAALEVHRTEGRFCMLCGHDREPGGSE